MKVGIKREGSGIETVERNPGIGAKAEWVRIEPYTANTVTAGAADPTVRSVDNQCFVTPALNSSKTRGELMLMYFVVLIFFLN